jgi:hypothetical protein
MSNPTPGQQFHPDHPTSDEHLGAVEGDRANDSAAGNRNAPGLDDEGLPKRNDVSICEDVLGANTDETQG